MALDDELKQLSIDWAEKIINVLEKAITDPTVDLDKEAKKVYKQLSAWGWFNKMPLSSPEDEQEECPSNAEVYITMLAMEKYRQLKWDKDHPKPSKWERVTGIKLKPSKPPKPLKKK